MTGPLAAILLTLIVHVVAFVLLFSLCGREILDMFRATPYDDDGGGGEPPAGDPQTPPGPSGGGLPLPDAQQAPVRLREPARLGERYPRPARRPEHDPAPQRQPERA
jgi:hypothetical protein